MSERSKHVLLTTLLWVTITYQTPVKCQAMV